MPSRFSAELPIGETRELLGKDAPSRARRVIRTGDVLVSKTRPSLNGVTKVPSELDDQICTTGFCVLRAGDALDPTYLFAYVRSEGFVRRLSRLTTGASYPAVNQTKMRGQPIPVPPLPEQKRVAETVEQQMQAITDARVAVAAQREAAGALRAAYLRAFFESAEAEAWPTRRLGDVAHIGTGLTKGRTKKTGVEYREVPYLRVANVQDGYLDLSKVKEIPASEKEIRDTRLQQGDLLLTEGGDPDKLGRGTYWQEELPLCLHQNHLFKVRFDQDRFVPAFVSAQIGSHYGKRYFLKHAKQTTGIATINKTILSSFPLLVPPREMQERVARDYQDRMDLVEQAKRDVEEQRAAVAHLPAALLRLAFRAEL